LRYAAHKLILKLDPEAARKRKEAARAEAHVRQFREGSGNAGIVARELPADEVLASWQHVEQRALELHSSGMPGTLRELRVRAYLDLLQERDSRDRHAGAVLADPSAGAGAPDRPPPDSDPPGGADPDDPGPGHGPDGPGENDGAGYGPDGPGPAPGPGHGAGPSLAALVSITVPLATWQGRSEIPGEAAGFGLLDGDDARDLLAAADRHPATRWCLTVLNPDGTATAHGCLPGRHPPPGTGRPGWPTALLNTPLVPVARGPCDHAQAEVGYHPSRKLAHLIRARSASRLPAVRVAGGCGCSRHGGRFRHG